MDQYPDVFFTDADVARFATHLSEQGLHIFCDPSISRSSLIEDDECHPPLTLEALERKVSILPSADALRVIREEKELEECHQSKQEFETSVTVKSLPYVFGNNDDGYEENHDQAKRCTGGVQHHIPSRDHAHTTSGNKRDNVDNIIRKEKDEMCDENYSEGGLSDELIDSEFDDEEESPHNSKSLKDERGRVKSTVTKEQRPNASDKRKSKTLIRSSEAIGTSIIKSIPDEKHATMNSDSGWHSRRSKSDIGITRRGGRSLLKSSQHRRKTLGLSSELPRDDMTAHQNEKNRLSRPSLRFMAAPRAVNKRKKQMTLESMFKK